MPTWFKGYLAAALLYGAREAWLVHKNHHVFVTKEMTRNISAEAATLRAYLLRPVVRGLGFPYYAALEIYEHFE